jgi:hypothetical protein
MSSVSDRLAIPFRFQAREMALPPDMRTSWRIAVLLMLLSKCHGDAATLGQAHVLNWAIRSEEGRAAFLRAYNGSPQLGDVIQRFDPTLDRTIDYAVGCRLAELTVSGRVRLTEAGSTMLRAMRTNGLFEREADFLSEISGKFSQRRLDAMVAVS